MAVSLDTTSRFPATAGATDVTAGTRTFSHAGSASAKGAIAVICVSAAADPITSIQYGDPGTSGRPSTTMPLIDFAVDATEIGRVYVYFLGDLITGLGGTQTVTLNGATTAPKFVSLFTVLSATSTVAVNAFGAVDTTVGTAAQVTLTTTADSMSFGGAHSGAAAPSATPVTGCTLVADADYGALSANTVRRTAVDTAGSIAVGVTTASDDFCACAVAIAESTSSPPFLRMTHPSNYSLLRR